jgi:uncharacterized protein YuzE
VDVQLVVGAGAVGTATAQLLAGRGGRVRLVTRSGAGPEHPANERGAADASDADALSRLAERVAVIYSCAGPAYPRWVTDWPPLAAALLQAAQTSDALLVSTGNLYGYGAVDGPMTERLPLQPNTVKARCGSGSGTRRWKRTRPAGSARPRCAARTISYDSDADAVYIHLGRETGAARRTTTQAATPDSDDGFVALDSEDGRIVGIEILDASSRLSHDALDEAEHIS